MLSAVSAHTVARISQVPGPGHTSTERIRGELALFKVSPVYRPVTTLLAPWYGHCATTFGSACPSNTKPPFRRPAHGAIGFASSRLHSIFGTSFSPSALHAASGHRSHRS